VASPTSPRGAQRRSRSPKKQSRGHSPARNVRSDSSVSSKGRISQGKPLLHRHQVLHLPHSAKNKFVLTGWRAYEHPIEALKDLFTLHNETGNVATALLAAITLFFTQAVILGHGDLLHDHHESALLKYGIACGVNAILVAAYHALAPYGKWYNAASAMDILAIVMVAWASQQVSFTIHGASAFAGYLDSVDSGLSQPNAIYTFLKGYIAPLVQAWVGAAAGYLSTRIVAYYFMSTMTLLIGAYAVIRRTLVSGETPLPLLALNFAAVLFNVLDLAIAAPRPFSYLAAASLFFGGTLYAAKIPERFFLPKPEESAAIKPTKGGNKKKLECASLLLPSPSPASSYYRSVDIFFHSHMFHHIAYSVTMLLCASDFAYLAMKSACSQHGAGSDDARCALFR
jgi:Haemolysin-III related